MKIIQTLWTKPGLNTGWCDEIYHIASWTYSCLQLRKYYPNVELYTDQVGKTILKDWLELPYTNVHCNLDSYEYPNHFWAGPKILSYGSQNEPFLHVDGDVYIFEKFDKDILNADIFYQNTEYEWNSRGFYTKVFEEFNSYLSSVADPQPWICDYRKNNIVAFCAGVMGGNDNKFFKDLAKEAFNFFDQYFEEINQMKQPQYANHMAEQVLSYYLAEKKDITHKGFFKPTFCVDPNDRSKEDSSGYYAVDHFGISPNGKKYVHYIGGYKKSIKDCQILLRRLKLDYPKYYEKLRKYIPQIRKLSNPRKPNFRERLNGLDTIKQNQSHLTFKRTSYIARQKSITLDCTIIPSLFISQYQKIINESGDEFLQDIFEFEKFLHNFKEDQFKLSKFYENEFKGFEYLDNFKVYEITYLNQWHITVNPFVGLHHIKWNWTDLNQDPILKSSLKEEQKLCLFIPDKLSNIIYTEVLTDLCHITLYSFQKYNRYEDAEKYAFTFLNNLNKEVAQEQIFKCFIYLINLNALKVEKPLNTLKKSLTQYA